MSRDRIDPFERWANENMTPQQRDEFDHPLRDYEGGQTSGSSTTYVDDDDDD